MKKFLAAILIVCASISATAQDDKRAPLERYEGDVAFALLTCGLSFSLDQSLLRNNPSGQHSDQKAAEMADYNKCIRENKVTIKKAYEAASRQVKKATAKATLKEHYISATAALQGVAPQIEERKIDYQARQSANKSAVDKAWARFEVEN